MISSRRRTAAAIVVAAIVGGGTGIAIGLSEDDDAPPVPSESTAFEADQPERPVVPADDRKPAKDTPRKERRLPPPEQDPEGLVPGPSGDLPETDDEEEAARAARSFVNAIDSRDAGAVCDAFASGALEGFRFPATGGSCERSVSRSLGFRGGRGQPVWSSSEVTNAISAEIDGNAARVVATIFTEYADVREPTIEDDIIYLTRSGDEWLVAKPSLTLYRAVGDSDAPPSVISPP